MFLFVEDTKDIIRLSAFGNLELTFYHKDQPSLLKGELLFDQKSFLSLGSPISLVQNEKVIFKGFIFTWEEMNNERISFIAYDQIRYLQSIQTLLYKNKTAADVIKDIAHEYQLSVGELADTAYTIPYRILEEKSLLDSIYDALDMTFLHTGTKYLFFDDCGLLSLKETQACQTDYWFDVENIGSVKKISSIDNSFNTVTLLLQDDRSGHKKVHTASDVNKQQAYGILQYYKRIPVKTEKPQEMATTLLATHKNAKETIFVFDALGVPSLRAGYQIYLLDDPTPKTIKKITHRFYPVHVMDMELI